MKATSTDRHPGIIMFNTFLLLLLVQGCVSTSVRYHGHRYPVIETDNHYWMAENLSTEKFRFGKPIQKVTDDSLWTVITAPAFTMYNNSDSTAEIYGLLYNWKAVEAGRLCPLGWHISTDEEWLELEKYLGGTTRAGGRIKSTTLWKMKNVSGDDIGFNALPSGYKRERSYGLDYCAVWWTSTPIDSVYCWGRRIVNGSNNLSSTMNEKENGFSVRCVKKK